METTITYETECLPIARGLAQIIGKVDITDYTTGGEDITDILNNFKKCLGIFFQQGLNVYEPDIDNALLKVYVAATGAELALHGTAANTFHAIGVL